MLIYAQGSKHGRTDGARRRNPARAWANVLGPMLLVWVELAGELRTRQVNRIGLPSGSSPDAEK